MKKIRWTKVKSCFTLPGPGFWNGRQSWDGHKFVCLDDFDFINRPELENQGGSSSTKQEAAAVGEQQQLQQLPKETQHLQEQLHQPCLIYSFGISNDPSFELSMAKLGTVKNHSYSLLVVPANLYFIFQGVRCLDLITP